MSTVAEAKLLKDLRVADLKTELEKRGQVTSGVKAVLVERLQSLLKEDGLDPETFDFNENDGNETKDENTGIGRVKVMTYMYTRVLVGVLFLFIFPF